MPVNLLSCFFSFFFFVQRISAVSNLLETNADAFDKIRIFFPLIFIAAISVSITSFNRISLAGTSAVYVYTVGTSQNASSIYAHRTQNTHTNALRAQHMQCDNNPFDQTTKQNQTKWNGISFINWLMWTVPELMTHIKFWNYYFTQIRVRRWSMHIARCQFGGTVPNRTIQVSV